MAERRCPSCGEATAWEANPHRPFCSARCRMVDLQGWLGERYAIPGEPANDGAGEGAEGIGEPSRSPGERARR